MSAAIQIPTPWLTTGLGYRISVAIRSALSWLIFAALLYGLLVAISIFTPATIGVDLPFAPLVSLGLIALGFLSATVSYVAAGRIRYQLREEEICYEAGILNRTMITLPYDRVQMVSTNNTLIDRMLGISHVVCQSAADQSSVTLPGLPKLQAELTRAVISERSRRDRQQPFRRAI